MEWTTIPDERIRHVWRDVDTDEELTVTPDWYAQNGTPITPDTGLDCEYVRTEVLL